jgi:hypothetical protein
MGSHVGNQDGIMQHLARVNSAFGVFITAVAKGGADDGR